MATAFEAIATVEVGSGGAANIDFTSIPATYTDLCLVGSCRTNGSFESEDFLIKFNNLTTNFSRRRVGGTGSSAFSDFYSLNTAGRVNGATSTSNTFNNFSIYIPNYAGSNAKSASYDTVTEQNGTTAIAQMVALLWNNTSAIDRITLYEPTSTIVEYSTATLYGIKNS